MQQIHVQIQGTAPLLQHRFAPQQLDAMLRGATKSTGAADYSLEWLEAMYRTAEGYLYQPAGHIEGALVEASRRFKIKGARGKTWREPVQAYCYVAPDEVLHLRAGAPVKAPGPELLDHPLEYLRVDIRRVRVNRGAIARSRLLIREGWELSFRLEVLDEQLQPDVVQTILEEAGRAVGIGDYRPRFGRFVVTRFEPAA